MRHNACGSTMLILLVLSAAGCEGSRTIAGPTPPGTGGNVPAPTPTLARYHLSGRVTDEGGSPLSGAGVEVDYSGGGGPSIPPSSCPFGNFCWLSTRPDGGGYYAAEFDLGTRPIAFTALAYVYSWHAGYEANTQLLPPGTGNVVQDLRLRRVRRIGAGGGITVPVEPDSSFCSDLEDLFVWTYRCEVIQVETGAAGTLIVEARAAEPGGIVPTMFWATTGNYTSPPVRTGPGTLSVAVRNGIFSILVGVPVGTPSQNFDVLTSLR